MRYDSLYVVTGEEMKRNKLEGCLCLVPNGYNHESTGDQYEEVDEGRSGAMQADHVRLLSSSSAFIVDELIKGCRE